jgi:hypothetical protein
MSHTERKTKKEKRIMRAVTQLRCTAAAVLYSFFAIPFSLLAQDLPLFRSDSTVVVVPVTVTDRSGRFVPDESRR